MPIYEYECKACKKVHELIQKFSDAPMKKCPDCGKPVTKLISLSSFSLKGSGYDTTDSKRPSEEAKKKADAPKKESGQKTESAAPAAAEKPSAGGCAKKGCGHKH